jgi:hypothetical protein
MAQRTRQADKFGASGTAKDGKGAVKAKTESQTLVEANPGRVALYVTNDGEKTVYLALGEAATKNEGIRLNAEGGAVVIDNFTGKVTVVTAAGESVVTFSEI